MTIEVERELNKISVSLVNEVTRDRNFNGAEVLLGRHGVGHHAPLLHCLRSQ